MDWAAYVARTHIGTLPHIRREGLGTGDVTYRSGRAFWVKGKTSGATSAPTALVAAGKSVVFRRDGSSAFKVSLFGTRA